MLNNENEMDIVRKVTNNKTAKREDILRALLYVMGKNITQCEKDTLQRDWTAFLSKKEKYGITIH